MDTNTIRVYKFLPCKWGLKALERRRLKITTIDDTLNDPFDLLPFYSPDPEVLRGLHDVRAGWARDWGICCFSPNWKSPVSWAHYADNHKGFALGFDVPVDKAASVHYHKDRIKLQNLTPREGEQLWLAKSEEWSYEREIRMAARLEKKSGALYFNDFDDDGLRLREIIVGFRNTVKSARIHLALGDPGEVEIIKAKPADDQFEMVADKAHSF